MATKRSDAVNTFPDLDATRLTASGVVKTRDTASGVVKVFRFGCRAPREPALAEQILGQAWLYREDLRRIYNAHKREVRTLLDSGDAASHVVAYEHLALNAATREARARRGHLLDCGTYWLIEAAMLQASKMSRLDPIKRQDWDGTGRIGAAIQSVAQFPATEWDHPRVSLTAPNEKQHAELFLRIGTLSEGRSITWPVKLHRSFPEGAIVKQVAVQRTRYGHRLRWEMLVTLAYEETRTDAEANGVVGIDIGWRSEDDSDLPHAQNGRLADAPRMRVATHDAEDDDGALFIDTHEAFTYSDAVRGTRDQIFEDVRDYAVKAELEGAEHARLWRDKSRMYRLAERTRDFGARWWVERDKHLEDIECGVRTRAVRRRLDGFRRYADMLAKRYRIVSLEDMPMADWVGEGETSGLERRRSIASLGLLQQVLAQRFGPERTDWTPSAFTSMTCSACGHVRSESVGPAVEWICTVCGVVHHQDHNAATIIRTDCERWIDEGNPPRARKRKASKGKGKKNERDIATGDELRMVVTPREPVSEAAE